MMDWLSAFGLVAVAAMLASKHSAAKQREK
jgi:hypothetical protein